MPGSSQLPISTTLGIIDHLGDDPVSLFTCSLVCLSWMTRSRAHTFYHLVVDDAARLRTLLGLLRGGTHSFRFCTRELYLGAQWPFPEHMDLSRDDFILLLASLPTLQALTLANIRWSADTPLPLACTPHTPRHLSTLRLYHLHAAGSAALGMAHLSSLLRLFSGIGALDMLYDADAAFSTDDAPAHACAKVRALPALGELTLLCSRAKPRIIRWLANAGVFDGLESLQLWLADEEAAVAFGRVVRASGKSLKTLGIYLIREGMLDATPETIADTLDLSHCTALQTFKFWVPFEKDYTATHPDVQWQWNAGFAMVNSLPRSALRRVQVVAIPRYKPFRAVCLVESIPCKKVKQVVQAFPRLEDIDIVTASSPAAEPSSGRITLRAKNGSSKMKGIVSSCLTQIDITGFL